MKFAIAVSGNTISGPGEAEEILVYDMGNSSTLLEAYENPALTAPSARGIVMLRSVIERGAEKLVISGIGEHALQYANGRIELLNGNGLSRDEVLSRMVKGAMEPLRRASHHGGHHHTHS